MEAAKGIPFDLGLPDGSVANFRFDNRALMAQEEEAGCPVHDLLAKRQATRAVTVLLWSARLHEERWAVPRASMMIDRFLMRTAGPPPERPSALDTATRRAYALKVKEWNAKREEGALALQIALGDAMVEAGAWSVNLLDEAAMLAELEADKEVKVTGPPDDVSDIVSTTSPPDPTQTP